MVDDESSAPQPKTQNIGVSLDKTNVGGDVTGGDKLTSGGQSPIIKTGDNPTITIVYNEPSPFSEIEAPAKGEPYRFPQGAHGQLAATKDDQV